MVLFRTVPLAKPLFTCRVMDTVTDPPGLTVPAFQTTGLPDVFTVPCEVFAETRENWEVLNRSENVSPDAATLPLLVMVIE